MTLNFESWNVVFRRADSKTGETQATWTIPKPLSYGELHPDWGGPVVSPDLMTVVSAYWEKNCKPPDCTCAMRAFELATGGSREILRSRALGLDSGSISPDGREIAFVEIFPPDRPSGTSLLMIMPIAGGPPREIYQDEKKRITGIAWTQDGGHVVLFFDSSPFDGRGAEVRTIPTQGGSPEKSPLRGLQRGA